MLISAVLIYLAFTIGLGLYASRRVQDAQDYLVAGRSLPLYMSVTTVFATWLGAETVLSVSATFADPNKGSLHAVMGDPFGASLTLVLAAVFFAPLFYKMRLLTIGDFYRDRFGERVELVMGVVVALSYLGWSSAQLTALGLVLSTLSGGALSLPYAIVIGTTIVLIYTTFGGMWSVALTDLVQTVVIVVGLSIIAYMVSERAGGVGFVLDEASRQGKLTMLPSSEVGWWALAGTFCSYTLGALPQQDIFQRITSAKDAHTARWGTLIGGLSYLLFAFVPIFIAFAALLAYPELKVLFESEDGREIQRILPELMLTKMPVWSQVLFFGALISAILSTASGSLLAPTAVITENLLMPHLKLKESAAQLRLLRLTLILFSVGSLLISLNSKSTMYELVGQTTSLTLVTAFVPLVAGSFWSKATAQGALLSALLGLVVWLALGGLSFGGAEGEGSMIPPQVIGLGASIVGMVIGSLLPSARFTAPAPRAT